MGLASAEGFGPSGKYVARKPSRTVATITSVIPPKKIRSSLRFAGLAGRTYARADACVLISVGIPVWLSLSPPSIHPTLDCP